MPASFPPPYYVLGSTTLTINGITSSVAGLTLSGATFSGTTNFPGGQGSGITTGGNLYLGGTNKLLFGNISGDAPITHSNTLLPSLIGSGAAVTDAKTLFYELSSTNWAGEGVDNSGNYWRRVGLSGGGSYQVHYADGGVYIGPSPTSPGAGNLLVNGNVLAGAGSISIGSNIVGSSTSAAYTIGADPNAVGGGYIQVYGSASSNTVVIGVGATHKARLYASGGFYVGDAPADPGTGNLLVGGKIGIGITPSYGFQVHAATNINIGFNAAAGLAQLWATNDAVSAYVPIYIDGNPLVIGANSSNTLTAFGGLTSSFPALQRSGITLKHVLADGSGTDAPMSASDGTFSGNITTGSGTLPISLPGVRITSSGTATFFSASDSTRQFLAGIDTSLNNARIGSFTNHDLVLITNNTVAATINTSQQVAFAATVKTGVYTVAGLPTAGTAGRQAAVNNATQTLTAGIGAIVAGGGANTVPVFDDGTNWRIG